MSEAKFADRLSAIDRALYRWERRIAGGLLLSMGIIVFFDVVHRVFSRAPGRISILLASFTAVPAESLDQVVSPAIIAVGSFLVALLAIRTRAPAFKWPAAVLSAAGVTLALALAVELFTRLMPEGIVWAPYLSLCVLLWAGLIGASMATHCNSHLALEFGEKIWPKRVRPLVQSSARACAGAFSLLIALLGAMSTIDYFELWLETPQASLIPSIDLPKWVVFAIVPYAFGAMGVRFLLHSAGLVVPPNNEAPS